MKIHSFIFTWLEYHTNAKKYEDILSTIDKTTVINSNTSVASTYPKWMTLQDLSFFSHQWRTALSLFDKHKSDILFHCQADIDFTEFQQLIEKAKYYFEKYNCGIYAPNIDYTSWVFPNKDRLKEYEPNVFEVPQTDETCWFIHRDIIENFPILTHDIYGWYVDYTCIAISRILNRPVIRDYNFTIKHPKHNGYSYSAARSEFTSNLCVLPHEIQTEILAMQTEIYSLRN